MKGSRGFILPPIEHTFCLPSGTWSPFECCLKRSNACVRSVCKNPDTDVKPVEWEVLQQVHTKEFLDNVPIADIFELDKKLELSQVLTPLRYLVGSLIKGTLEAYTNKSIVIVPEVGGHHASPSLSHGACVFADVPVAWLELRKQMGDIRALYIDTDVHHADGFARSRVELNMQDHFFIMDMFNMDIWPCDEENPQATETLQHVNVPLPFHSGVSNKEYITLLKQGLKRVETELPPIHMVFYMCHNDALKGDSLGKTNVTERAIYERDMLIVDWARERDLPIVIMPNRGYGSSSCRVARESMAKINDKYNVFSFYSFFLPFSFFIIPLHSLSCLAHHGFCNQEHHIPVGTTEDVVSFFKLFETKKGA